MINVRSAHYKPRTDSSLTLSEISLDIPEINTPQESMELMATSYLPFN